MNRLKYTLLKYLDDNPQISKFMRGGYGKILYYYTLTYTGIQNIRYAAPLDPFKLYWVPPDQIAKEINTQFWFQPTTRIVDGDWDKKTKDFEDHYFYQSLKNHFEEDVPWKKTQLYNKKVQQMQSGDISNYRYGETKKSILRRLQEIDTIYESISEYGYLTQRELRERSLGGDRTHLPPELFEIAVNIGRNGDWLFDDGRHRLIISKLIGIESIPVRILVRHSKWQQKRDRAYSGKRNMESHHLDIPN